jgi:hypothetical protein
MSRIVGDAFFPEDVLDSSTSCSSSETYPDVCPERFSRLEKELVRGKGEIVSLAQFPLSRYFNKRS